VKTGTPLVFLAKSEKSSQPFEFFVLDKGPSLHDVEPGIPCHVTITARGFANWESPVVILDSGQYKILDVSKLRIEEVQITLL
jgi:hypothetical protein